MTSNLDESPQSRRALVVEDEPINRQVMELILEAQGIGVTFAPDGAEALRSFADEQYDLVLMDLQMPLMDGFDAISGIRALEAARRRPRTPIVVVSAHTRTDDRNRTASAGADLHLGKPVNVPVLLQAISAMAPGRPRPSASA